MTVTHQATGSRSAGGTTTVAPSYPAGVSAGRLAIASRVIKPQTATGTAEAGWTQQVTATGGTGTTGADVGQTRVVVDTLVLTGGESGSVTFDNASTPNSSHGVIQIYTKTDDAWSIAATSGSDTTHGTGRSATGAAISLAPGDVVVAVVASDTDDATAWTSPAITASGITFGSTTERLGAGGVTTGNDCGLSIFEATVSSGTASAAPTLTLSGNINNCGPVAFIRLRELPPSNRQPPTLIAYSEVSTWLGTGTKATGSVSWQAGDVLVILGAVGSNSAIPTPTATGLTFTGGTPIAAGSTCWVNHWSATAASSGSDVITSTGSASSGWGMAVWVWRGSEGTGGRVTAADTSKTVDLTRTQAESAVLVLIADFAADGVGGYSWTPAVDTERWAAQLTPSYDLFVGEWLDEDAAGTTTYGVVVGGAGVHSRLAIEILGAAISGGPPILVMAPPSPR